MRIGRKIYYDLQTGNVILDTGERQGSVVATTIEKDIQTYSSLSERNRETFNVLELEFGQRAQDFNESNGYRVNTETKTLEFSYPDPNAPEEPQPYQPPLSVEVDDLKRENTTNMLAMVEMYEENLRLKEDNTNTMLALTEMFEMMSGGNV